MRIGIDLRDMAFPVVGVGQTTLNILSYIENYDKENEYVFYQYAHDDYCNVKRSRKVVMSVKPYAFLREQIFFSAYSFLDDLDVFHAPIHLPPLVVPKKTKIIFTVHDIHSELDSEYFPHDMNQYFICNRKRAIQRADAVIVHTEFVKKVVLEHTGISEDRLKLIPLGVHPDFLQNRTNEEKELIREKYNLPEKFVLYVGSVEPWKQVPLLIEEFLEYKKATGDNIGLVVCGRPGWSVGICDKVRRLCNKNDNVQWLDYVGWGDLPIIYSCATVFSSASKWEGFGLIFTEAMGAGVPIVASNKACVPEVVGDAGLCFDSDIKGDYAEKLQKVLSDKELYKKLKMNCKERVKLFNFQKYGKRVHKVYTDL